MKNEKNMEKVVGAAFEDMNVEEMENIQGAGDVDAETLPTIIVATGPISTSISMISTISTVKR